MSPYNPTSPKQPLDAEERALAERLARSGPHGEPSSTLDSRILSAAHAAVGHPSSGESHHRGTRGKGADGRNAARHGRRPRWPLGLGIAASLVLAIGLAWQMRPLPDASPAYRSEADSALASAPVETKQAAEPAVRVVSPYQPSALALPAKKSAAEAKPLETPLAEDAAMTADQDAGANRAPGAPAMAAQTRERQQEQSSAAVEHDPEPQSALSTPAPPPAPPAPPAPRAPPRESIATAPAPPIVLDAPSPTDQAHPITEASKTSTPATGNGSLAAPSTEMIAASQTEARSEAAAQDAAASKASTDTRKQAARANAPPQPQPSAFESVSAGSATENDKSDEAGSPANVASPLVRDAWLQRIRTLATQGRLEEARDSLRVFVLRYPGYLLPIDLRTLQDTTPGSPPADGPTQDEDTSGR